MSGNSTILEKVCPECGHSNALRGKALTLALTCKKCGVYFRSQTQYHDKFINSYKPYFSIGSKAKITDKTYELLGFTVKREKSYGYKWHEYTLFNPHHGIVFLSESNGHWNLLHPNPDNPWLFTYSESPSTKEGTFNLYSKSKAEVVFAQGEFLSDVVDLTDGATNFEYINPPYLLTYEENKSRVSCCLGKYITRGEVANIFSVPISQLPAPQGMGYTEPLLFSFKEQTLVLMTLLTMMAAFVIQLVYNNTALNEKILYKQYDQIELTDQKFFLTPSFQLKGGEKNLQVNIFAPINNDWFFAEFSLINDLTDEEYVFTNEIEYYYGYEGGESWTEGSQRGEAFLSSIPGGSYHINVYPEFSGSNQRFEISVIRDVPYFSNLMVLCFFLILFPVAFYIYKHYKNVKRWEDSNYSPYDMS
jgi:hypothetical protein